jgi:hypothetical protein
VVWERLVFRAVDEDLDLRGFYGLVEDEDCEAVSLVASAPSREAVSTRAWLVSSPTPGGRGSKSNPTLQEFFNLYSAYDPRLDVWIP